MNETEKYLFDLNGYLHVKGLLAKDDARQCLAASEEMQKHIEENIDQAPIHMGHSSIRYRFDRKYSCHSYKNEMGGGLQFIVDDFLNASVAFDCLVNHPSTMAYVNQLMTGPYRITSSELRYRHRSNTTHTHMGGPVDSRNRYEFVGGPIDDISGRNRLSRDFDLLVARVLYAVHDIPVENGPLCVVPGSHKSHYFSPFDPRQPLDETGMIPLPMEAGDAIIFTENLRHGGFPNLTERTRKTLHLAISPSWVASMSPVHWNGQVHVSPEAWRRYSDDQRAVMPPPSETDETDVRRLRDEVARLKEELARLEKPAPHPQQSPSLFRRILGS